MENRNHRTRTRNPKTILVALATFAWLFASRDASATAVEISFAGGNYGKQQYQSNGDPIPVDSGFYFEVGAFAPGFDPRAESTENWLDAWSAVTAPDHVPRPGATTEFTTRSVNLGFTTRYFPGFTGKVFLEHNGDISHPHFTPGNQGYIWGYNTRTDPGAAQWILMTRYTTDYANNLTRWGIPAVVAGTPEYSWTLGNADTAIVGLGNGTGGIDNSLIANAEMTMFEVTIPGPVPEPTSTAFLALAACAFGLRRRR